ncbi:CP family cyanate transporter-like MFS transporter [Geodermatophilus tzadiensis]|uniref:CP family cyanate transporter-like MFS transporter n=1 Tax=Geodermatophilus tzadiensis TaxID=1137988 RepID=A0A2T0SWD8_9ACTN|nr:MFS transporter [Geodermatophilus tzadiensis]PRY37736.1 CP family cyanate transporter-like MFS transporter [Geodermatophilus tzadiensis]
MTRTAAAPSTAAAPDRRRGLVLVAVAIVLTAANLRTAVSSVGPVLEELEAGLGVSSAAAGVVTTMPVVCFAAIGFAGPPLAARFRDAHVLAGALLTMAAGLVLRAVVDSFPFFLVGTALAMVGGALGNVLLPGLVKRWFPGNTGLLVGAYSAAMAIGGAVAATATAPIAAAVGPDGWRLGLGVWAVLALLAALPWFLTPRQPGSSRGEHRAVRLGPLRRSPTALVLALFFGLQATQAYVVMGWSAQYLRDAGLSAAAAGLLLGVNSVVVIPVNAVAPALAVRQRLQRPLLLGFMACYVVGWGGLFLAPRSVPWLWMSVLAVGMGTFSMVLALIGVRARTAETVAALSTFTQSWGYVLAAAGPLLVGVLRGVTGGYTGMFWLVAVTTVGLTVTGWLATRPRYVDDELPGWSPAAVSPAPAASPRG